MSTYEIALDSKAREVEWNNAKCDKYDYMISVFCGLSAGIIDAFFVGTPGKGRLGQWTDKTADNMVQKIANMLWTGDKRSSVDGRPKNAPDTLEKAISYLEQSFPVNYDARYGKDLINGNAISGMSPLNHHLLSLAHSPDIIGLLFSIIDQFTGKATFINNGKLIRLVPVKDARNNKVMYMQGTNFESKVFCGVCNWLGHLISDLCGSSSTRKVGKTGRGAGLPIPFYNLFLLMDLGKFDSNSFADIAVKIFEEGYDLRHGAAMAIPVLIEELSIKVIWALKQHCYAKKEWKDCIPSAKHADLRMMLLIGNATLCLVDGIDAAIRTGIKGGNPITFILHLNLVAWARLVMLVFRELKIRYGSIVDQAVGKYLAQIGLNDAYSLKQYYERMNAIDQKLDSVLRDFTFKVEDDYKVFIQSLNYTLNSSLRTPEQGRDVSVAIAKKEGVKSDRIFRSQEELRYWLGEKK
ncbi:hypothetical protein [Agathobacter sp.]